MAVLMEAYPKLSHNLFIKTGYCSATYEFYYHDQGVIRRLRSDTADTSNTRNAVLKLEDDACRWHPENDDLIARYMSIINVPSFLFGENGLASRNGGVIGLALMWMDSEASQRGAVPVGEITSESQGPAKIEAEITFSPGHLRGDLILRTIIYLKKPGIPDENERFLASQTGTILGVLDDTKVIIDGNGSVFPVCEVSYPGEPLWWVQCSWEDPRVDSFTDDNFCLYLNTAHRDYPLLNGWGSPKNSALFLEVICSTLQILITKVLDDDVASNDTIQGNCLQPNSISSMVNYLLHAFGINYERDNPETMARNIRKALKKSI